MVKLLGILLAFIASSSIGFLKAWEIKSRKAHLIAFREMLLHISTEMGYFKEPLPQIFAKLQGDSNEPTDILLRQCLLQYQMERQNFPILWENAVEEAYGDEPLTKEDLAIMKKCGEFLGQSDYHAQQNHLQLLNMQLDKQIESAEDSIRTKGSLYSKAGISIGLVIAIALI